MYHYKSESPLAENSELKKRKAGVSILRLTNDTAFATIRSTTGKQKLTDLDKPNKNKEGSSMSNKKIVFCGCGPMGEGILGGLLNNNVAKAKDVTVNELLEVRRTYIAETYGVAAVENTSDALKAADLIIIAVNPAQMPKVAQTIRPLIKKACIVMSIACGVSLGARQHRRIPRQAGRRHDLPRRRDDRSAAGAAAEGLRRSAHELRRRRRQKGKFDPLSKANQQAASPPREAGRREKPHREEREMTHETKTKLAGSADAGRLLYLV